MAGLAAVAAMGAQALAGAQRGRGAALVAVPVVLVGGAMVWPASARLEQGHVAYTLVQPNISQDDLNDPTHFEAQFEQTARLSMPFHPQDHRLLLWPESGVPDYMRDGYPAWLYQNTFYGDPWLARLRLGRVAPAGCC
jgi:apolipoprotein N-acyltransferase